MYTWEKPFASLVHEARKEEIGVVRSTSYYSYYSYYSYFYYFYYSNFY